jgi:sec-independent protein translocase protein TatB
MEILGIGVQELMFILIIALIVLGPKDMEKAGRTIGKWLRGIVTSDGWKVFQQTSREVRNLPNRLIREANEEINNLNVDLNKSIGGPMQQSKPYGTFSTPQTPPPAQPEAPNSTQPPQPAKEESPDTNA